MIMNSLETPIILAIEPAPNAGPEKINNITINEIRIAAEMTIIIMTFLFINSLLAPSRE